MASRIVHGHSAGSSSRLGLHGRPYARSCAPLGTCPSLARAAPVKSRSGTSRPKRGLHACLKWQTRRHSIVRTMQLTRPTWTMQERPAWQAKERALISKNQLTTTWLCAVGQTQRSRYFATRPKNTADAIKIDWSFF